MNINILNTNGKEITNLRNLTFVEKIKDKNISIYTKHTKTSFAFNTELDRDKYFKQLVKSFNIVTVNEILKGTASIENKRFFIETADKRFLLNVYYVTTISKVGKINVNFRLDNVIKTLKFSNASDRDKYFQFIADVKSAQHWKDIVQNGVNLKVKTQDITENITEPSLTDNTNDTIENLTFPPFTTEQIKNIRNPKIGTVVFNSDDQLLYIFKSSKLWVSIGFADNPIPIIKNVYGDTPTRNECEEAFQSLEIDREQIIIASAKNENIWNVIRYNNKFYVEHLSKSI